MSSNTVAFWTKAINFSIDGRGEVYCSSTDRLQKAELDAQKTLRKPD
ncbi:MAG: hypothetical protein AAF738_02170 [Bacteroidota bacterium]